MYHMKNLTCKSQLFFRALDKLFLMRYTSSPSRATQEKAMAETIRRHEFVARNAKYPWNDWLDGRIWRLTQGKDFRTSISNLVCAAYPAARKRGGRVRTDRKHDPGCIILQFYVPRKQR